ncbi:hypothetical protein E2C01_088783 [Portunus trituberculatus]|uniref:Uncharacterized protein n=1 Tax=Portunus trituberculatus TaxID=210409 RepID=A0A5B7JHF3_PORTR|nr:hypothetical protein [Portunus trituberculatus]
MKHYVSVEAVAVRDAPARSCCSESPPPVSGCTAAATAAAARLPLPACPVAAATSWRNAALPSPFPLPSWLCVKIELYMITEWL